MAAAASTIGLAQPARAATATWTGGGDNANWTTGLNWNGGAAPLPGDALHFTGFGNLSNNNDFPADTNFTGITFGANAGAFFLGGNRLTLGGNITDNAPNLLETIDLDLLLSSTRDITVAGSALLRIQGDISGGFGLNKNGGGTLTLTGLNTFTGPLVINAGTVSANADTQLGAVPLAPTAGLLVINGIGGTLTANDSFTINANRGIAVGPSAGSGDGVIDVPTGETLTYGGVVANNGAGTGGLSKTRFGNLVLFGQNTYSGPTSIKNGVVNLSFETAGSPVNNIINPASSLVLGGANAGLGNTSYARLQIEGADGATNSQTFASTQLQIGPAVIDVNSGTGGTANLTLGAISRTPGAVLNFQGLPGSGAINTSTLNTNGILGGWATIGADVQNGVIQGGDFAAVDGSGNVVAYTGYAANTGYDGTAGTLLQGNVTAASNVRLQNAAASELRVAEPNANVTVDVNTIALQNSPGGTGGGDAVNTITIGEGNTLRLGTSGAIFRQQFANQNNTVLGGNGGGAGVPGVLNTNTLVQNIGTLTAGGPNPNTPGEIIFNIASNSETSGTFRVGSRITDNGTGAVTVVKTGAGSIKLDGNNTFSGGLYILAGRVQFTGSENGGVVNPDGGGSGPLHIFPGGQWFPSGASSLGSPQVYNNAIFMAGSGINADNAGAIRLGGGGLILAGTITLTGDSGISGGGRSNGNSAETGLDYTIADVNVGTPLVTSLRNDVTGKITGPFGFLAGSLGNVGGNGTAVPLSNPANDWTGNTTIAGRTGGSAGPSVLILGADQVIPDGVGMGNLSFGITDINAASATTLNMNGHNETVNGLTSQDHVNQANVFIENNAFTGTIIDTGDPGLRKEYNFAPTHSVLTVGNWDQSATFGGLIRNANDTVTVALPNPDFFEFDHDMDPNTPDADPEADPETVTVTNPAVTAGSTVGVTKIGTGLQVLTNNNTYTGPTNVQGGVLAIQGSLAPASPVTVSNAGSAIAGTGTVGNVTVNSGGAISPGASGVGTTGTLTLSSLAMNGGDLAIDFGSSTDLVSVVGAAAFTGANTITPSGSAVTGTYTILTAGGGVTGGGTLTLGSFPSIPDARPTSGSLDLSDPNAVKVNITGAKVLTWTGATNGNWDLGAGGTVNWVDSTPINEKFFNADVVNFNDGPTNRTITLNATIQPGNVNFNNNAGNDYTIQGTGSIAGLNGVWKQGNANATIATNNTFTGQLRASGGTLLMSGNNTPGSVRIDGGTLVTTGNLNAGSTDLQFGELRIGDGGTSGTITGPIANGGLIKLNRSDSFAFSSAVSGAGALEILGGGNVTMSGNSSYTGETRIISGTATVTSFNNFGALTGGSSVVVSSGGAIDLAGIPTANLGGGFGLGKSIIISGDGVGGTGAITNSGTLAQQNAFSNIQLAANATVGGTGRFDLRGGTGGPVLALNGHTLTKVGTNQFSLVGGTITGGNIIVNGGTFAIETSSTAIEGGSITVNAGTTLQFHQLGTPATGLGLSMPLNLNDARIYDNNQTHASSVESPVTLSGTNTFEIANSTGFTFSGSIGGAGGITKAGNGRLVLTGTNNFTGALAGNDGKVDLVTSHVGSSAVSVSGDGVIELTDDGSANKVINTGTVSAADTGRIDIKNNKLISTSPAGVASAGVYNGVQGLVQSASNGGAWDGPGITTSMPDAVAALTSIGVATGEQIRGLGPTDTDVFAGQTINGASTIAMYTYGGDANLDGLVSGDDYSSIDFNIAVPNADGWYNGDFNYDGIISGDDYSVIDFNIAAQGAPFPTSGSAAAGVSGVTAVPEPAATLGLALLAAGNLARRRRRNN